MKELVLLNHKTSNFLKLKNELEEIHRKVTAYDIEHGRNTEIHPIEKPALFICRTETDSDNIVDDALRIISENGAPILFVLSRPEECSYDRIASMEMAWYIKEPYTKNELKCRIKEAVNSAKICDRNYQLLNERKKIDEHRKNGDSFEGEYRMITKNGGIRYWKEHGIRIIDGVTKEIDRTIGVCSDITEKIDTEDTLKEKDEMFRLIAENANDVIWILDANGNVLYVSPSVKNLRGFTPEELREVPVEERFTPESVELIKDKWTRFFREFRKGVLPDVPRLMELEQRCKNGSTVWVEMHINPVIDDEGNFKFFLGISRNIDERRKNALELEKQAKILDTIFDLAPVPMLLVSTKETIENINQTCMDIAGFSKEKAIGKRPGDLFSCINSTKGGGCGSHRECMRCAVYKAELETFATKKNLEKKEGTITVKLPDNSHKEMHVLISTAHIDLYGGKDAKVIIIIEDITERKVAERATVFSMMKAEEANRTKSEFLSTMSHELRTPLNAILGYSQMLLNEEVGELNTKQKIFTNHVHTSGKHLLELINDILDLSKIEAGKMDLHYEQFDANDVMKNVCNIIIPLAEEKNIDIDFLVSEDIKIYADNVRFKQILYNLMSNAVKFTPEKGHVIVKAGTNDGHLTVSVIDNGIGMSEKEQERLFTPFYQADSSISRKYQGTGLGLFIVKKMLEFHDGTIEVESETGKGSTFTFTMPLKK